MIKGFRNADMDNVSMDNIVTESVHCGQFYNYVVNDNSRTKNWNLLSYY